jgi:signal transduction histidine kinase
LFENSGVFAGTILYNNQTVPIFIKILPDKVHRRTVAISADSSWIAGALVEQCRKFMKSNVNGVSYYRMVPRSATEPAELMIPFRTVFTHQKLTLPIGSEAAGKTTAKRRMALIASSTILMIFLLLIVLAFWIRLFRQQLFFETRSIFLGHVSHELKTPLTLMMLYAETLAEDKNISEDERQNSIGIIKREGERLNFLIDNLLQSSKIGKSRSSPHMTEGDFGSVIEKSARFMEDWLRPQGFELNTKISPGLPPVIFDPEKIAQTFINLVENAQKYSGDSKSIDIRLWADGSNVILEVEDRGIGIPESDQKNIFEQYFRGSNVTEQKGVGLGLFIVNETMKEHKGSLEIKSEVGKGSRFRLIFPAANVAPSYITPVSSNMYGKLKSR